MNMPEEQSTEAPEQEEQTQEKTTPASTPKPAPVQTKPKADEKPAAPKKPAFGGYAVNFAGRKETAEQIFGSVPIAPSEMTKKLWAYVKNNKLSTKK